MPAPLARVDRQALIVAGAVLVLLVSGTLILAPARGVKTELPTTYSTASAGAKAAYLLLKESGYHVDRWERSLTELPAAAGTTLVRAEPTEAPVEAEARRLRQFIADGGRVIATGVFAGAFIPGAAVVPRPWMTTWERARALAFSRQTRAAPEISLVPGASWTVGPSVTPLYGDGQHVLVVRYPYGRGEIIWWASPTPLTNAGLKEPGNMPFFLACLGPAGGQRVLWDEYFHGYRQSSTSSVGRSPLMWLALQLALLAVAIVATFSRRSGPIMAPAGDVRLSPLEFVHTLGGLYQRAKAGSIAVDICLARFRHRLARRLGTPVNAPVDALARALRDRWGFEDAGLPAVLHDIERARAGGELSAKDALRLVRSLWGYSDTLHLFPVARRRPAAPDRVSRSA